MSYFASSGKTVVFVPHWVFSQLRGLGVKATCLLNPDLLKQYVSLEDMALVYELNKRVSEYFGFEMESMSTLDNRWFSTTGVLQSTFDTLCALEKMNEGVLKARLFNPEIRDYTKQFEILDIDSNALCVVIYPGEFASPEAPQYKMDLLRGLLKQFYAIEGYETMARRNMFCKYIEQMPLPVV